MLNKIMIVGESWGKEEAAEQLPFVGYTGAILRQMLRHTLGLMQGSPGAKSWRRKIGDGLCQ